MNRKRVRTKEWKRRDNVRQKRRLREVRESLKSGGCVLCGYNRCRTALEFHHVNADKEREVSKFQGIEKTIQEAEKCIVVCANCHREIHSEMIDGLGDIRTVKRGEAQISFVFDSTDPLDRSHLEVPCVDSWV